MDRSQVLERVLRIYAPSYDIEELDESEAPLKIKAAFHEHGVGYMLVQRAQMWTADRHEYSYIFSVQHLTKAVADDCVKKTLELGEPLVKPEKGHMSTMLVTMILCDDADDDALEALKRVRVRKSFQFSLRGWMEVQTAAAVVGKATAVSNPAGKPLAKFLKSVMTPKEARRRFPFK